MVFVASFVLWAIVDLLVSPESERAKIEAARRDNAIAKIIHACAKAENLLKVDRHLMPWLAGWGAGWGAGADSTGSSCTPIGATSCDRPSGEMRAGSPGLL